jgi:PLP dependent protein
MNGIEKLKEIKDELRMKNAALVAVSKTKTPAEIKALYNEGQRIFGENKVQELLSKTNSLPTNIQWHLIGHLQTNKVKQIASFISMIQSVDSEKLLIEINKQAEKNDRVINCLLQIHIAQEETKFGFSFNEAENFVSKSTIKNLKHVTLKGLMGMASNTTDFVQVKKEFLLLNGFYKKLKKEFSQTQFDTLSMGMSSDYKIAIECGSNMIRIGSLLFGERKSQ